MSKTHSIELKLYSNNLPPMRVTAIRSGKSESGYSATVGPTSDKTFHIHLFDPVGTPPTSYVLSVVGGPAEVFLTGDIADGEHQCFWSLEDGVPRIEPYGTLPTLVTPSSHYALQVVNHNGSPITFEARFLWN